MPSVPALTRTRGDLCPGVLRPWPAPDGALVRLRLLGGQITASALAQLSEVARLYGDGVIHVTGRANLQVRGLPGEAGGLAPEIVRAFERTGLLPSRTHELVRNFMMSPLSGRQGGRADLRPVLVELDALLRAEPELAGLPGRFLFVLDDGRGDLAARTTDLGLVALDDQTAQLRIGSLAMGPVLRLSQAPGALVELALDFVRRRGTGPDAAWHVDELGEPLAPALSPESRATVSTAPLAYGVIGSHEHVPAPDGILDADLVGSLVDRGRDGLVVTPWRGVLVAVGEESR